GIINTL
nr:Chain B, GLY-ILE-ILE-ASN-THR-LEU [Haemophilus influenzae 86-028NP]